MKSDCRFPWIIPILPTVYGDELSYYECLSKLRKAIADVATNTETLKAQIESMKLYQHRIPVNMAVPDSGSTKTINHAIDIVIISKSSEAMTDQSSTEGIVSCSIETYFTNPVAGGDLSVIPMYEKADIVDDILSALVYYGSSTTEAQVVRKPASDVAITFTYGTDVVTGIN